LRRRSSGYRRIGGFSLSLPSICVTCSQGSLGRPATTSAAGACTDTLEWLIGVFASQSPGIEDDLLLLDSTPVECACSRETVKRSQLADAADYGYCASHSRFFWGFRLHALCSPDGTPRAMP
jgi:hypothetical protein